MDLKIRAQLISQHEDPARGYEIVFIRAGEANGWTFNANVLQESIPLWEQTQVFVDHSLWGHSVRDLGGVIHNVRFQDDALHADLIPAGPSKEVITEAARIMLMDGPKPDLGFSADVVFSAKQKTVQKILRALSVDLVIDPAFTTGFIRQLNSKGVNMADQTPTTAPVVQETLNEHQKAVRELMNAQTQINAEVDGAKAVRLQMCKDLLSTSLSASNLPEPAQKDLRTRFADKAFEPKELSEAIKTWREALAQAAAPNMIAGPGRISGMFDTADKIQAAIDDLMGAPREPGSENLHVEKFSGIREAYVGLTGDREFVGGYFPERVLFQHTAATFPGILKNALNKSLVNHWKELGRAGYDWWNKIVTVEHFDSVQDITWLIFGTVGSLPSVSEGAEYTELQVGDGAETSSFTKYGGYIGVTLEAMDKDDTRKIRAIPRELANAGLRNISATVAAIFTTASAAGPTMADGGALFNSTAVTTAGGHANLLTTALGTDTTAWRAVMKAMYNQPMLVRNATNYYGTGKKMAIKPKYCLVPIDLAGASSDIFLKNWNASGPVLDYGVVEPIVVPEWTDATDWAAVADPNIAPAIMVGERFGLVPQIFVAGGDNDPAMFSNDEARIKVRHFLAIGVADFRPLHKENVAG